MTLEKVKTYLNRRINTDDILKLSDEELTKYFETSKLILNTFYVIDDIQIDDSKALVYGEEMLFLFNSNIDINLFYQYNGLSTFDIGGAVKGTVDYSQRGELIPNLLKAILASLDIPEKMEDPTKRVKNVFTCL